MKRAVLVLLVLFALPGCESLMMVEGGSAVVTGERLSDHVISLGSGKTCSMKRKANGLTYCEEDEAEPVQNVHCYRTIGAVTCYDREPEFADKQQKVGVNDHNLVHRR